MRLKIIFALAALTALLALLASTAEAQQRTAARKSNNIVWFTLAIAHTPKKGSFIHRASGVSPKHGADKIGQKVCVEETGDRNCHVVVTYEQCSWVAFPVQFPLKSKATERQKEQIFVVDDEVSAHIACRRHDGPCFVEPICRRDVKELTH